jgi:hypothetical protein
VIDGLILGRLIGTPQARLSKNDHAYVTVKLRVPTRDRDSVLASAICFSSTACKAILALDNGDAVAVSASITPTAWLGKDSQPKAGLDLLVHSVLSEYAITKKRAAVRDAAIESAPSAATGSVAAGPSPATIDDQELDDALPPF